MGVAVGVFVAVGVKVGVGVLVGMVPVAVGSKVGKEVLTGSNVAVAPCGRGVQVAARGTAVSCGVGVRLGAMATTALVGVGLAACPSETMNDCSPAIGVSVNKSGAKRIIPRTDTIRIMVNMKAVVKTLSKRRPQPPRLLLF